MKISSLNVSYQINNGGFRRHAYLLMSKMQNGDVSYGKNERKMVGGEERWRKKKDGAKDFFGGTLSFDRWMH